MSKLLRDVYVPTKDGKTELLKKGGECPKDLLEKFTAKGWVAQPEKPEPKKK